MKTNKNILFSKDSVNVKKETFNSMEQVIKTAKQVQLMQPKINNAFKTVETYKNNLSKTYKENNSLHNELENLSFRCKTLENKIEGLSEILDYLESIIGAIISTIYEIFTIYKMIREEEKFRNKFSKHISEEQKEKFDELFNLETKNKDDDLEI